MADLQPVRGTRDLIGEDVRRHRHIGEAARTVAERFGYGEIVTPIMERTEVFARTLGETSDIVTKEMYTFQDKGGEWLTLRPENTAGVCRAFISGSLGQQLPVKLFYFGPMFRHERPQKGRLRQFHQIGIELIGVPGPEADIEAIACAAQVLSALHVLERTVLHLNTLGDGESRNAYRAALVEYFTRHRAQLSEDSLARLERNPLRILDSKDLRDRAVVAEAPSFADYLTPAASAFFDRVRRGLDELGIGHAVDPRLVRGLDYYCHTAFEFVTDDLGAQGTVLGGGRYDGLIGLMGGPETPGVGWAAGVERLAMLVEGVPPAPRPTALVPVGAAAEAEAARLAYRLRAAGLIVDLAFSGNLKRRMARAARDNARWAVLLGDDELARGAATVRDMDTGTQEQVPLDRLAAVLGGR